MMGPHNFPEATFSTLSPKPFIRVDNSHLIPIHRITEISFIEHGIVFRVGDFFEFNRETAELHAEDQDIEEVKTHILVIHFSDDTGHKDIVRRTGSSAFMLWEYLSNNLAIP